MAELKCLRCDADMEVFRQEKFQLGEESGYTGILAVMTAESMMMDIYKCPNCGKIEFFEPWARKRSATPKTNWTCSECGQYNFGRVQTCQSCGVTRVWSDSQKKKE